MAISNGGQMTNELTTTMVRQIQIVQDVIPVLDTGRFEHMQRIASIMAHSSLMPDALCKIKEGEVLVALTPQEILSNCFLVVNQAVRWGMDPFAVAQCVSVVHGKLCYEGKLVAAVLEAKLGIALEYAISGEGEAMSAVVSGAIDGVPIVDSKGIPKTVRGTVAEWKTTGRGSPWSGPSAYPRMLRYRGAREWSRAYASSILLGVYSDDEMQTMAQERQSHRARETRAVQSLEDFATDRGAQVRPDKLASFAGNGDASPKPAGPAPDKAPAGEATGGPAPAVPPASKGPVTAGGQPVGAVDADTGEVLEIPQFLDRTKWPAKAPPVPVTNPTPPAAGGSITAPAPADIWDGKVPSRAKVLARFPGMEEAWVTGYINRCREDNEAPPVIAADPKLARQHSVGWMTRDSEEDCAPMDEA